MAGEEGEGRGYLGEEKKLQCKGGEEGGGEGKDGEEAHSIHHLVITSSAISPQRPDTCIVQRSHASIVKVIT